jgi:hypothetical protein
MAWTPDFSLPYTPFPAPYHRLEQAPRIRHTYPDAIRPGNCRLTEQPQPFRRRLARAGRFRVALWDDAGDATPLDLPAQRMWPAGIAFAVFFAIFAGVLWVQIVKLQRGQALRSVSDLMGMLFEGFWIMGWSVGVLVLFALTVLFLFYGESARLAGGRLVTVSRLGPVKFVSEYDLARIRNLRLDPAGGDEEQVQVRFDYGDGTRTLGGAMPREDGALLVESIRGAAPASVTLPAEPAPGEEQTVPPPRVLPPGAAATEPVPLTSPAALALLAANLVPLAGVLFGGWSLATVVVLFWSESAIIGFYTLLKMAVVGKWAVLFAGPFFVAHFGAFMAAHFLFIYEFFVRGIDARGPGPPALDALRDLFVPLWPALAALFVSHGVSFCVNFLGRSEHDGPELSELGTAPYKRIMIMQLTIIFGGWIVIALKTPVLALVVLVLLKIAVDFHAHRRERERAATPVLR